MEYDNKQLGRQLAVQSESCLRLQQQLDKRTVQLMSTQREVEDLQSQLELLHTALVAGGRERRERVGAKGAGTEEKRCVLSCKASLKLSEKNCKIVILSAVRRIELFYVSLIPSLTFNCECSLGTRLVTPIFLPLPQVCSTT